MRLTLVIVASASVAMAYNNGLGAFPPRGWATWCTDDLCGLLDLCFEQEVQQIADAMVQSGMRDLGYNLVLLDDCWASVDRDANGNIQPDPTRFPSGIPALADYVHERGLLLGLYTCAGERTCKYNRTGSGGHQQADAKTFASWTVDYVKEDNCGAPNSPPWVYYGNMSTALNETGRPMWLATCNWGEQSPWLWAPSIAQSYRAGPDHLPLWNFPGSLNGQGVINIIEHFADINNYTEPYGWADPDFLMTGLVLTDDESESEFAMWSIFGGPMIISTDVRNMTTWKSSVVLNSEILAVNNDTLRAPGRRVFYDNITTMTQVWSKDLASGDKAVVLLNFNDSVAQPVTVLWSMLGWSAGENVTVYDLWAHSTVGTFTEGHSVTLTTHANAMWRLSRSR